MSEVRTWLDGIGLAQYANAFEANDIDIDLLGQVDDQVLKDIGVSSAGHRLRIRNAIGKLGPTPRLKLQTQQQRPRSGTGQDRQDASQQSTMLKLPVNGGISQ